MKLAAARETGRMLLETVFPGRCLLCGEWLLLQSDHRVPLCARCAGGMKAQSGPCCRKCGVKLIVEDGICVRCRNTDYSFESSIALFPYATAAKTLLESLKFRGRRRLVPWFAVQAWSALRGAGRLFPLVPVPSRKRTGAQGIVGQVTACLQRNHGMTVTPALERRGGAPQKSLNYAERQENLKQRIHLAAGYDERALPEEVVLVDDVFTTGATLDACARVLRAAGCSRVYAITLAIEE